MMIGDQDAAQVAEDVISTSSAPAEQPAEHVEADPAPQVPSADQVKPFRKFTAADASAQLQEAIKSTQPISPFDGSSSLSALLQVLQNSSSAPLSNVLDPSAAATPGAPEVPDDLFTMDTKAASDNPFTSLNQDDWDEEANGVSAELLCYQCPMRFPNNLARWTHVMHTHQNMRNQFICPSENCEFITFTFKEFLNHLRNHRSCHNSFINPSSSFKEDWEKYYGSTLWNEIVAIHASRSTPCRENKGSDSELDTGLPNRPGERGEPRRNRRNRRRRRRNDAKDGPDDRSRNTRSRSPTRNRNGRATGSSYRPDQSEPSLRDNLPKITRGDTYRPAQDAPRRRARSPMRNRSPPQWQSQKAHLPQRPPAIAMSGGYPQSTNGPPFMGAQPNAPPPMMNQMPNALNIGGSMLNTADLAPLLAQLMTQQQQQQAMMPVMPFANPLASGQVPYGQFPSALAPAQNLMGASSSVLSTTTSGWNADRNWHASGNRVKSPVRRRTSDNYRPSEDPAAHWPSDSSHRGAPRDRPVIPEGRNLIR